MELVGSLNEEGRGWFWLVKCINEVGVLVKRWEGGEKVAGFGGKGDRV